MGFLGWRNIFGSGDDGSCKTWETVTGFDLRGTYTVDTNPEREVVHQTKEMSQSVGL